jgi:hypothetical protein
VRETTRESRTARTLAPVACAVTISLLLAGCDDNGGNGDNGGQEAGDDLDRSRMAAVAADEGASAADVVDAGRAVNAASSGDAVLVTYTVDQGTSEGRSAGAWRLYDAAGDTVATEKSGVTEEGAAFTRVTAVPDGFLVDAFDGPEWHVGPGGAVERAGRTPGRVVAQSGDVALSDGSTRLYRPPSRAVFTPTPRAPGNRQGWTLTDDGTQWMQRLGRDGDVPFSRSTQQGTWEPAATYTPDRGQVVSSLALTAVGDRIVVPLTAEGPAPDEAALVGLLVRRTADPVDRPWQLVEAEGVRGRDWWDLSASAVDESTVAVGTSGSPPYLVDLEDRTWTQMGAPTGEEGWRFDFEEGRVFATHSEHADAWVSEDRGERWSRLPH